MAALSTSSHLLDLPLELRDFIYELSTDDSVRFNFRGASTRRSFRVKNGLLRTNRQIHQEYLSLLWRYFLGFGTWTFRVENSDLQGFMGMYDACNKTERQKLKDGEVVLTLMVGQWGGELGKQAGSLRKWFRSCERTGFSAARYDIVVHESVALERFSFSAMDARSCVQRMLDSMSERMKADCTEWMKLYLTVL